jgi:hypothetical protein
MLLAHFGVLSLLNESAPQRYVFFRVSLATPDEVGRIERENRGPRFQQPPDRAAPSKFAGLRSWLYRDNLLLI